MARLIDLLTFSGAVGDMVGCNGPHGFYIRSRPSKPAKAPTPKQLEARAKLSMVMRFLKPLKAIIYRGFMGNQSAKTRIAAMNAAASHVLNQAMVGAYPDLRIDPAKVRLSRGTLLGLPQATFRAQGASVDVSWSPALTPFSGHADDEVTVVVYNPQEKTVLAGVALRSAGTLAVDASDEPPGSELLVYACVCDRTGRKFANSQFLGRTVR